MNPYNGPGGKPILPDANYQRSVAQLQGFSNVTLLGYVHGLYGQRDYALVKKDIDTYHQWDQESRSEEDAFGEMSLDGIFIDEVDFAGQKTDYFKSLCQYVKSKKWRGRPGTCSPSP